jgi:ABC-2 type transport system ATP-binding protein
MGKRMAVIQTRSLTKYFGTIRAVEEVSLEIQAGEIYGFLGLNGAGKTTLIRLLLGMIKPSWGTVFVLGKAVGSSQAIWSQVGYLVETPQAYPNLSVEENLEVYGRYRNLTGKKRHQEVLDQLLLTSYRTVKARHLSLGNRQRLGLAKALLHQPALLILDEPINGLDPAGIVQIRQLLQELAGKGTTILLSSHLLAEIAKLATRMGVIHQGRLLKEFTPAQLEAELQAKLLIDTRHNPQAAGLLREKGYPALLNQDQLIELSNTEALRHPEHLATLLVHAGLPPKTLYQQEEDLESYFLRLIQAASPAADSPIAKPI